MASPRTKSNVVESSGNVFADLLRPDAEEKHTRVRLAVAINRIIAARRLSQSAAARRLHVNQPKVSALLNYRLEGFSVERLMKFLVALGRDIEIVVHPKHSDRKQGRIRVTSG